MKPLSLMPVTLIAIGLLQIAERSVSAGSPDPTKPAQTSDLPGESLKGSKSQTARAPQADPRRKRPIRDPANGELTATMTIRGRALDENDQPIKDSSLILSDFIAKDRVAASTATDHEGRFEFRDVTVRFITRNGQLFDGDVQVFGVAEGYAFAWSPTMPVELVLDDQNNSTGKARQIDEADISLLFRKPQPISGRVVDVEGHPIPSVVVTVENGRPLKKGVETPAKEHLAKPQANYSLARATTDVHGRFEIANAAPDTMYQLLVDRTAPTSVVRGHFKAFFYSTASDAPKTYGKWTVYRGDSDFVMTPGN